MGDKWFLWSRVILIKTSQQDGFTLVELLVVISIIALLLAMLMPSLRKAREQANEILCRSNEKQQYLGHMLYIEDNDGYFFNVRLWFREMMTYKGKKGYLTYDVIDCATARQFGEKTDTNPYGYWRTSDANGADPPFVEGGYGFSAMASGISFGPDSRPNKLTNHKRYAQTGITIDGWDPYWNWCKVDYNHTISYRHKGKKFANVGWLDGHSSAVGPDKTFHSSDLYQNWPNM